MFKNNLEYLKNKSNIKLITYNYIYIAVMSQLNRISRNPHGKKKQNK